MRLICKGCKAAVDVEPVKGKVVEMTTEHEDWCPFWRALQQSPEAAEEWVRKNGQPMVPEESMD